MGLIEDFIALYGNNVYNGVCDYLIKYDIIDKFYDVYPNKQKLFEFAVHHGIIDIVKYLYEEENVCYDATILSNYDKKLESNNEGGLSASVSTGSSNTSANIQIIDKFTTKRNMCLNYLMRMRKYSKYTFKNGHFMYHYNRKYKRFINGY